MLLPARFYAVAVVLTTRFYYTTVVLPSRFYTTAVVLPSRFYTIAVVLPSRFYITVVVLPSRFYAAAVVHTPFTCLFVYIFFWAGAFLFTAQISDMRAWPVDGLDVSPSFRIILSYGDGVA
jgi:hypothetical protein